MSSDEKTKTAKPDEDVVYAQVIPGEVNISNPVSGQTASSAASGARHKEASLNYVEVQLNEAKQRPKQKDVYTEVVPRNKTSVNDVAEKTDSQADSTKNARPAYENVQLKETTNGAASERQVFYMATEPYSPYTSSSQELAVEAGDVVQKEMESGDKIFGVLCNKNKTSKEVLTRRVEGWMPISILVPCTPEIIADRNSAVPVVRLDKEFLSKHLPHDVTSRCADTHKDDTAVTKETPPDVIVLDGDDIAGLPSSLLHEIPQCQSPILPTAPQLPSHLEEKFKADRAPVSDGKGSVAGVIRVVAVASWQGLAQAMAFTSGDRGELVYASDTGWLCVRITHKIGWVPADYWRIVTDDGRIGGLSTNDAAPWVVGQLSRADCERHMLNTGKERDFVVRSSPHLTGQYALSVKHGDRIHHFPIVPTEAGKFYIGKHHFSTLHNVIIYYSKSTLFSDDNKVSVTLGQPFRMNK